MTFRRADAVRSALLFVAVLIVAAWPARSLRQAVSEQVSRLVNPLLEQLEYGQGGHARLHAAPVTDVRGPDDNVTSDAELVLSDAGTQRSMRVGVSLRREFYLPLVVFAAAALAAPTSRARRGLTLLLGLPLVFGGCTLALHLTVCWLFAHEASYLYPMSERALLWLDTTVATFLTPPTLRLIVPLLLAVALVAALEGPRSTTRRA